MGKVAETSVGCPCKNRSQKPAAIPSSESIILKLMSAAGGLASHRGRTAVHYGHSVEGGACARSGYAAGYGMVT